MESKYCLNCKKELTGKYCSGCGQKADTHRITFNNFISHDVLHGIFHIEKGMLFTAKQALIRPGTASLDYIAGKRKPYYNVFLFILLTIGLMLFLKHFYNDLLINQGRPLSNDSINLNQASKTINNILSQKTKIIIFLFVPFAALNSFILFNRKKLNLSEHFIIAGMILLGALILYTIGNIFFYLDLIIEFTNTFTNRVGILLTFLIFLYIGYGYYNAFGSDYSTLGFSYRTLFFFMLIFIEMSIMLFITIGMVTNWEFGEITISLF
ncbi:DUF3667 domain-containing protein [Myroides guanonis]|uniref:DUF3667 domain-containing protein n=1 Tax=Myroides guanonis TaxID=1150112 RepID=A0A1I3LHX7_9FLAO|nr:DUF3667 domain-containing protein [Myroides guanonis]SFI84160.1 Protein of unknown function [Myroides guanonis]